ncbi:MAG: hypothetical protein J6O50_14195 [Ruminiclostridium sp.]|nr:hypothetical protein [Ruminiclostridium sp.]
MKEVLKKAAECIDIRQGSAAASARAEYPAMFLYVGDKAAERMPEIKADLSRRLANAGSIRHAVMSDGGSVQPDGSDMHICIDLPENRGECVDHILRDDGRLSAFNSAAKKVADGLMMTSGFPLMSRCFLFIVTTSDCRLNAVLPEFVMLVTENAHIRVNTLLFTDLGESAEGMIGSAAFFRELEYCQKSGFVYDGRIMMREDQRISVHWEGAVFGEVFFLEMYRSDMKYCGRNAVNNSRIAAAAAALLDREDPPSLPRSVFFTAGLAYARRPDDIIAHIMYKALADMIFGFDGGESRELPAAQLFGYEAVARICDRVMQSLPDVSTIVPVMPETAGRDPDAVRNTNVRDILGYYGGADEKYFDERFAGSCARMIDCCESIDISAVFGEYINKGTLRISDVLSILGHDGAVTACLGDVTERLSSEEEELTRELDDLLSQPCPGLAHGLFAKPSGCEIIAAAVSAKYGKKLEILRVRMMKRLVANLLSDMKEYEARAAEAVRCLKAFSDALNEDIMHEIYDNGSTLTDVSAFTVHYTKLIGSAAEEFDRGGGIAAILHGNGFYDVIMNCGRNGAEEAGGIVLDVFRKLAASQTVRAVFSMSFDEELYARYKDFEGGKDPGWVDAQLIDRLREECRANLRYSVFQPSDTLCCMGSGESAFVKKMREFEDPAFSTVFTGSVNGEPYEQLAVYSVPSVDSVVYVNECMKVYDGYSAENGGKVMIDRSPERTSV